MMVLATTNFQKVKGLGWKKATTGITSELYTPVKNIREAIGLTKKLGFKHFEIDVKWLKKEGWLSSWKGYIPKETYREWYEFHENMS